MFERFFGGGNSEVPQEPVQPEVSEREQLRTDIEELKRAREDLAADSHFPGKDVEIDRLDNNIKMAEEKLAGMN